MRKETTATINHKNVLKRSSENLMKHTKSDPEFTY